MAENIKGISLPVHVVDALFDFAGRPLSKDEWKFLNDWQNTVRQGVVNARREQEATVTPPAPFDPTSDAAAKKREQRAQKRAEAEAKKRLKTTPDSASAVDNTAKGDKS